MGKFRAFIAFFHRVEAWFCLLALATIVVCMSLAVLFRYVFLSPLTWTGDVGTLALVWLCFVGAGYVYADGGHVAATGIVRRLPAAMRQLTALVLLASILVVTCATGIYAYDTFLIQRPQFITTLGVSRGFYALPVIWMAFSIAVTVLVDLPAVFRKGD